MSKRKGLSLDEKRTKMLEIFHESQDVFQMKDIEKLAPRAKGIIPQSVKSVLQELVDDGLVDCEKIGSSLYYWAFPGKAIKDLKRKIQEAEKKTNEADQVLKVLESNLEQSREKQKDVDKITQTQNDVSTLKKRKVELEQELAECRENDPEVLERKETESKRIFDAANRWTDNIFSIKTWCKQKFGAEEKDLDKNFAIPEDFDYLDNS